MLDEIHEVHGAVRQALRARGLVPGIDHRFEQRGTEVWVVTRANGQPVAGTVIDGTVVLERVDRRGHPLGAL